MSPIKLYGNAVSPYCRNVTLVLDLLGLDYEDVPVDVLAGDAKKPDFIKKNVQHNIPVLEDGNLILNESQAIMVYLVEKYGKGSSNLFPIAAADVEVRARIHQRLCFNFQVFFDSVSQVLKPMMLEGVKEMDLTKLARVKEVFGFLQHFLKPTGFVAETKDISLADLACLATYTTFEIIFGKLGVELSEYPEVTEWADKVKKAVVDYEKANGKGVKLFKEFIRTKTALLE